MSLIAFRQMLSEELGVILTIADIVFGLISLCFPSKKTGKRNYLLLCICIVILLLLVFNYVNVKYFDGVPPTPLPTLSSAESHDIEDNTDTTTTLPPSDTPAANTQSDETAIIAEDTVIVESREYYPEGYYQEFPTDKPGMVTVLDMQGAGIVVSYNLPNPLTADEITDASWASDLFAIRDGIKKNVYYEGYDSICWLFMEEGIAAIELPFGLPAGNYSFDFIIYAGEREINGIIPFVYDGEKVEFN